MILTALLVTAVMGFENVHVGQAVPRVKLRTAGGENFDSAKSLEGKVSVIAFWRLNQEFSEQLLQDLQEIRAKESSKDVEIVAVCSGEADPEDVAEVATRLGLKFPMLLDPERSLYEKFGIFVAPATGFVDTEGVLRFYYPSYRRDFLQVASSHIELLQGKISLEEHEKRAASETATAEEFNPAGPHYHLGLQYLMRGDLEHAREELVQAWEGEEPIVEAGVELGYLFLRMERYEEALEAFSEVEREAPGAPRLASGKGVALLKTGNVEEGSELLNRALAAKPNDPFPYYQMGRWLEEQGSCQEAIGHYRTGLEIAMGTP